MVGRGDERSRLRYLERVKVDDEKVYLLDSVFLAGFLVIFVAPDGKKSTMHLSKIERRSRAV